MNGRVLGTTKLVDHGPGDARWDLVLLGDGYAAGELTKFESDVARVVDGILATAPFDELKTAINIHRVNVVSNESGASDAARERATFFKSRFSPTLDRLLTTDNRTAIDVVMREVPQWNATLMVVNTETYGGSGGLVPVFSTAPQAFEIALHEMGHSLFKLADEYPYYAGCSEADHDRYIGTEPPEPNVTTDPRGAKWQHLLTAAVPTTRNANCGRCDDQSSPVAANAVGTFEGARYFKCGLFRPAFNCRMNQLGQPFCGVCRDVIRRVLAPHLPATGGRRRSARS